MLRVLVRRAVAAGPRTTRFSHPLIAGLQRRCLVSGRPSDETEDQLKLRLTPLQYEVCRMGGTEPPFSNEFWDHKEFGTYFCRVCDQNLYESAAKFDSGTGWPSFTAARSANAVARHADESHGMFRIELQCSRCRSHLGHLFFDGPTATKERHCINSAALDFESK